MIGRNDLCWCGSQKKWKKCHYPEAKNDTHSPFALRRKYAQKYGILLKNPEQIEGIRTACRCSSRILEKVCAAAQEGTTTAELDALCLRLHKEAGATPAALHYGDPPFPGSLCTSVNEVICHGIPNTQPLRKGDILNIDIASILNEFYGDCSKMVIIGKTTPERRHVVDVAYGCLMHSIAILKPGIPISDIGKTIEKYAKSQHCSVVHQFVGHGVGVHFHEPPQIHHNYVPDQLLLVSGMTFTIEPMINGGKAEAVLDETNLWEARTIDGSPSAQWEHTLLITEEGHEILTDWT